MELFNARASYHIYLHNKGHKIILGTFQWNKWCLQTYTNMFLIQLLLHLSIQILLKRSRR